MQKPRVENIFHRNLITQKINWQSAEFMQATCKQRNDKRRRWENKVIHAGLMENSLGFTSVYSEISCAFRVQWWLAEVSKT